MNAFTQADRIRIERWLGSDVLREANPHFLAAVDRLLHQHDALQLQLPEHMRNIASRQRGKPVLTYDRSERLGIALVAHADMSRAKYVRLEDAPAAPGRVNRVNLLHLHTMAIYHLATHQPVPGVVHGYNEDLWEVRFSRFGYPM